MFKGRNVGPKRFGNKNFSGNGRSKTGTKSFYYQSNDGAKTTSHSNSSSPTRFSPNNSGQSSYRSGSSRNGAGNGRFSSRFSGRPHRAPRRRFGESIDVSKFVRKPIGISEIKPQQIVNTFLDFGFSPELQTNLNKREYKTPTPIQDQSIGHVMNGRDLLGLANTGTGKTAVFLLPLIDKVFRDKSQKVLILAPTRELALQIEDEFRQFSWSMKIFSAICVGGSPIYKQINNLKREPNFVIGTPGRLKDLSDRRLVKFETFNNIVIDEIDRMLDMGFVDEIKDILNKLPQNRQSLFFSATIPPKIKEITNHFLNNPETIEIKSRETAENVDQDIVRVRNSEMKFDQLQEVLKQTEVKKVLIFSETKRDVEKLANNLLNVGFKADSIHGDKKQSQRQRALTLFKTEAINILVATDVAARGLDIDDITHVINYTIPQTYTDYIHRIGRTGRGDKKGTALTFVEAR